MMGLGFNERFASGLKLFGNQSQLAIRLNTPKPSRTKNMVCQPKATVTYPPRVGAIIGDTPNTSINRAKTLALSFTGNKSRTIATEATVAAQLPNACINLNPISASMLFAKAQPAEARM
ncbi:hypothetical protein D3C87_1562640 [compost metagenome]